MIETDIILTTANARYSHCAFGLRRLLRALGTLEKRACIAEFVAQQSPHDIASTLLDMEPRIIGFGVYIWNVSLLIQVAQIIRAVAPHIILVGGGPELTADDDPAAYPFHYSVIGEGETAFAVLAAQLLAGDVPANRHIVAPLPDLATLPDSYPAYSDEDIRQRVLYVESSRGCPYRCAFCLSARDAQVRYFPLAPFLASMDALLARGARRFKFTDRTFNLKDERVLHILDFFLERLCPDMQLHFEIMPDTLSDAVLDKMGTFPPATLHLELGLQSASQETQRLIGRGQDVARAMTMIQALRTRTGAALHADLIVGLPGDTTAEVGRGFDMLVAACVHEIQVGLLKRLKGTAMAGDAGVGICCDEYPPYEVLQTPTMTFAEIQRLKRLARYVDLYYNSGNFPTALPLLWETAASPFAAFTALSERVWEREGKTHQLTLARLTEHLYDHLVAHGRHAPDVIARTVETDFRRLRGRRDKLPFLQPPEQG